MPRYLCHKVVHALKIKDVSGCTITPADEGYAPFVVPSEMYLRYTPTAGDYYVVYGDGYASFSPAAAFEAGYAPLAHPLDRIARVAHEINRAYCQALGDNSQRAWEEAPAWQRESARMGVDLHLSGDFGPEASHISWMKQKLEDGWTYGPVKSPELKQHPCIVPFDQLPPEQQAKDFLFRGVVHALR